MSEPSQPRIREGQAEVSGAPRRRRHRLIQICRAYDAARAIDDANQMIELVLGEGRK